MSGTNSQNGKKGRSRESASGHNFALNTLAETRQQAKKLVTMLDATDNVARNAIFLPPDSKSGESVHARAHSVVLSYADELTKPTYLIRANAQSFYVEDYATVKIPKKLKEGEELEITVDDPRKPFDPATYDFDMYDWGLSLQNIGWWSMRFIPVKKKVDSPYWHGQTVRDRKKIVLPPRTIRETFRRLDSLAAELGILLQISENSPHGKT